MLGTEKLKLDKKILSGSFNIMWSVGTQKFSRGSGGTHLRLSGWEDDWAPLKDELESGQEMKEDYFS
jgi:hypothetical protein